MSRKEEVENNNRILSEEIKKCVTYELTQEKITNLNLSAIAQELADVNITLAMIVDQFTSSNGNGTAKEHNKGKWIETKRPSGLIGFKCSECGNFYPLPDGLNFCPNCGAKMVEPQESEG